MTEKMNPQVKVKWLEALRSGRFTKAFGQLNHYEKEDCHCAMGVLHRLYREEGGSDHAAFSTWAGFSPETSVYWGPYLKDIVNPDDIWTHHTVGYYNDLTGDTFEVVADLIEEKL